MNDRLLEPDHSCHVGGRHQVWPRIALAVTALLAGVPTASASYHCFHGFEIRAPTAFEQEHLPRMLPLTAALFADLYYQTPRKCECVRDGIGNWKFAP